MKVWFYKETPSERLQSVYATDYTVEELKRAFKEYGEDGGPFFEQAENLTSKIMLPIVDSDVDGEDVTETILENLLNSSSIDYKVDLSDSDTEPEFTRL